MLSSDDQRGSGLDVVTGCDVHGDQHRRSRCADETALVPRDPVADAVDLDQVVGRPGDRDDVEGVPPRLSRLSNGLSRSTSTST